MSNVDNNDSVDSKMNSKNTQDATKSGDVSAKRPSQTAAQPSANMPIINKKPSADGSIAAASRAQSLEQNSALKQQVLKELSALKGQIKKSETQNVSSPTLSNDLNAMREEMAQMRNMITQQAKSAATAPPIAVTPQPAPVDETEYQGTGLNAELGRIRALMSNMAREDSVRRLSSTYANLAQRLDESVASGDVLRRLTSHMTQTQTALESLPSTRHFANFENQISNSNAAIERVEARIAQVNDLIKSQSHSDASAGSPQVSKSLSYISEQLDDLSHSSAENAKIDFAKLEQKIEAMGSSIAGLTSAGSAGKVSVDSTAKLESQISIIADLLKNTNNKFDQLEGQFDKQRDKIIDAARHAAEQAVAAMPVGAATPDMLGNLAQDIEALKTSNNSNASETRSAFMGIQTSLSKIVERLESLENKQPSEFDATPPKSDVKSDVKTHAVQPNPLLQALEEKAADDRAVQATSQSAAPARNVFQASDNQSHGELMSAKADIDEASSSFGNDIENNDRQQADLSQVDAPKMQPSFNDADDSVLEPGETPDPNNIGSAEKQVTVDSADEGMDFIAAARRAAKTKSTDQEAGAGYAEIQDDYTEDRPSKLRKPLIIASAAVVLAFAAIRLAPTILNSENNPLNAFLGSSPTAIEEVAQKPVSEETDKAENEDLANIASNEPKADTSEQNAEEAAIEEELPALNAAIGTEALRNAVAEGDPAAMFEVALLYTEGTEITKNEAEAAKWYRLAAERGLAPAQFRLGSLLEKGRGVEQDHDEAAKWYKKAASAGNARAMHNLGVLHTEEVAGGIQVGQATQMFRKAAELGVRDSQFNLGMMYSRGLGVALDLQESYKWFALAANGGDLEATKNRDQVADVMLPEDLDNAKLLVSSWRPAELNEAANTVKILPEWTKAPIPNTSADTGSENVSASQASTQSEQDTTQLTLGVQGALLQLGFDVGTPDGVMGPRTEAAIREFEERIGLPVTGRASAQLLEILRQNNT